MARGFGVTGGRDLTFDNTSIATGQTVTTIQFIADGNA